MSESTVAKRYALALFEVAREKGKSEVISAEMGEIRKVFAGTRELRSLLTSPKLSNREKKALLAKLFNGADQLTLNTLYVLSDAGRLNETVNVANDFISLVDEAAGIAEAKVYSTRPLTDTEQQELSAAFAGKVGKQSLRIVNIVDSSLIGGLRIRIGNRIYDNSLRTKLDHLKRDLVNA